MVRKPYLQVYIDDEFHKFIKEIVRRLPFSISVSHYILIRSGLVEDYAKYQRTGKFPENVPEPRTVELYDGVPIDDF